MRVLLVGAGAWAASFHAPAIVGGPGVTECVIWSRNPARARWLAAKHGMRWCRDLSEATAAADVVVCSVPPSAQAELVVRHAREGIKFVLEKPLAADAGQCREILRVLARRHVPSLHVLTYRFMPAVSAVLGGAGHESSGRLRAVISYRSAFHLSGAATWRLRAGVLPDVGPHLFDLAHWALGGIVAVAAGTSRDGTVECELMHQSGDTTFVSMNATDSTAPQRQMSVEVFSQDDGRTRAKLGSDAFVRNDSFLATYRSRFTAFCSHAAAHEELDAVHGAYLVDVVEAAGRSLASGQRIQVATSS